MTSSTFGLAALALALAGCLQDHAAGAIQTSADESCATCHLHDYQAVPEPVHASFPRTCDDCHHPTAWHPALEGLHPEAAFPIARGDHEGIACQRCHDLNRGRSVDGINTVCTSCHGRGDADDEHDEVSRYAWSDTNAAFCLQCHPDGRGDD